MHKQRLQRSEVTGAERFDGRGGAEKMFRCKTRTRSSVEYFWLPERKGLCSEGGWGDKNDDRNQRNPRWMQQEICEARK